MYTRQWTGLSIRLPGTLGAACITLASALLAACSTPAGMAPPVNAAWEERRAVLQRITHWQFTGSIRVRDDQESHSSRIRWQQRGNHYRINLWGAFNAGATEITGEPGRVIINQRGAEPITTDTPEELVYRELGYELPVSQLDYWLKGLPVPGRDAGTVFGESGQLVRLQQSGWEIHYLAYADTAPETLPARIRMEKPPLQVDLVRLDWSVGEEAVTP